MLEKDKLKEDIKTGFENALCSNSDHMNSTVSSILSICGVPWGNDDVIKTNTEAIIDVLKSQLIPVMADEIATAVDKYIHGLEGEAELYTDLNGSPTHLHPLYVRVTLKNEMGLNLLRLH